MPLQIIRNDITKLKVDAIVNAANSSLLGGGGVDGCIHRAAGPELLSECRTLNGCETGSAKITRGYKLPCKYVIHAVGPRWQGGKYHENLMEQELQVYLVIFDRNSYQISEKLFDDIASYIDDRYVEEHVDLVAEEARYLATEEEIFPKAVYSVKKKTLEEALKQLDESFSQMLLRKIDESGMTDAQCYKKANIDRKLFSKIRSDKFYKPSKTTVLAFALALELPLSEMQDMLQKAGFALSHSSKFDIIVEYFVEQGNYNVYEINEALFAFDQSLIGGY